MPQGTQIPGTIKQLSNGAKGAYYQTVTKDGKPARVFRIFESSPAAVQGALAASLAARKPRKINLAQAQQAFDKFYANTPTFKSGLRKGQPRFASPAGRNRARTYDLNHRGKKVVDDSRFLHNPHAYDFQGVDTGAKVRKPLSERQQDVLASGRAARQAKRGQTGGYWW